MNLWLPSAYGTYLTSTILFHTCIYHIWEMGHQTVSMLLSSRMLPYIFRIYNQVLKGNVPAASKKPFWLYRCTAHSSKWEDALYRSAQWCVKSLHVVLWWLFHICNTTREAKNVLYEAYTSVIRDACCVITGVPAAHYVRKCGIYVLPPFVNYSPFVSWRKN